MRENKSGNIQSIVILRFCRRAEDLCWSIGNIALRHQIAHVAITQLVSDIPSHGLNDKKMVEMTAFEEFGLLGRELGHAEDYP